MAFRDSWMPVTRTFESSCIPHLFLIWLPHLLDLFLIYLHQSRLFCFDFHFYLFDYLFLLRCIGCWLQPHWLGQVLPLPSLFKDYWPPLLNSIWCSKVVNFAFFVLGNFQLRCFIFTQICLFSYSWIEIGCFKALMIVFDFLFESIKSQSVFSIFVRRPHSSRVLWWAQ